MADFSDQLEEIKTLLSSITKSHKSVAYPTILHLQEQSSSGTDPSLIQSLAGASRSLLSSILVDISDDDEEIAAQALKCLGFMIYHPTLQPLLQECGVVYISPATQCIIFGCFHSLLRAIVHALDNPIGSLSTTFEVMQALVVDMKEKLHLGMKELLNHDLKIQAIQAWEWFIR